MSAVSAARIPRDPSATREGHTYHVEDRESFARYMLQKAETAEHDWELDACWDVLKNMARGLLFRYARGDSLEDIRTHVEQVLIPLAQRARQLWTARRDARIGMHVEQPASWMLLFALVCFDEDGSQLARIDEWFTDSLNPVLYAMVLRAFVPGFTYADSYSRDAHAIEHEEPVVAALLQPPETWASTLGAFMRAWPKLMKKYGYRDQPDDTKYPFHEFPLHLGLAVCAFDIDDTGFRHLPFYPADLVDYYRTHVRHTRDAWRRDVIDPGAGLPEDARPQPKKAYLLSKSEAYARWVALVCGEREASIARARKALGARKTMPDLWRVMEALASRGLGIQADIKDDETLEAQLLDLCAQWQLPAPALPAIPLQGPARISVLFEALQAHAGAHGCALAVFYSEGDTWEAVLHPAGAAAEFATLCEQLGIRLADDGDWRGSDVTA